MGSPRFVLVPSVLASGARRIAWPYPGEVVGSVAPSGQWVAWRLLGSNNHELGRSAGVFGTVDEALADVDELVRCDGSGSAELTLGSGADTSDWRWRLGVAGRDVAVSSRGYLRQRECRYSATMFRAALATAVRPAAGPVQGPGRRRATECLR